MARNARLPFDDAFTHLEPSFVLPRFLLPLSHSRSVCMSPTASLKKILVFGASGGTGRQIVSQALEQGHEVTAFVRGPSKVGIQHQRLHEVFGDAANDAQSVLRAIPSHDV